MAADNGQELRARRLFDDIGGKMTRGTIPPKHVADVLQVVHDHLDFYQRFFPSKGGSVAVSKCLSHEAARAILGQNFIFPADVASKLGMKYSSSDLLKLATIPFSESVLRECKDTHVLFPSFPLSIVETRAKVPKDTFYKQDWYDGEKFAKSERPEVRWHLIRKERVPDSNNKTYSQQLVLLSDKEENPSAVVLVQLMVIYYLMTGTKLFIWEKSDGVRSSSLSSDGYRVFVYFYEGRLIVCNCYDDYCGSYLGVASSRKFQK